jgi:hypothetical protein
MVDDRSTLFSRLRSSLDTSELASLGPESRPSSRPAPEVEAFVESVLSGSTLSERRKSLIRGLLLLWHDHLEEAHSIAQAVEDADGSLLHAIMHRREPDYGNAKYWFRRVGPHPCYGSITKEVCSWPEPQAKLASKLAPLGKWDPFAFVDSCESAAGSRGAAGDRAILERVQKIETEAFLQHLIA